MYVLSGTAGGIAPMDDLAAGMYPVVLGVAYSTTKMALKIVAITPNSPAENNSAWLWPGLWPPTRG